MKEEDIDWQIYHLITEEKSTTADDLVRASGLDAPTIQASLARLERFLLIEQSDGRVRALSFDDSLIRCQIQYSGDLLITIENGVIKEKKR